VSLLEELLQGPSAQDRMGQLQQLRAMSSPGGAPTPGSSGLAPFTPGEGANHNLALRIGGWIDSRPGFSVSGLEGYNGTGQISSGHVENSQHYTGEAGDVSYTGGGRFAGENPALDWLYGKLQKRWGDALTELLWQVPDHYDHLHYGVRPGG
jgi:hypothetical protein